MSKAISSTPSFSMGSFSLQRLLGGMSVDTFLSEYWQKKPLLVRQALPGFGNWLDRKGLSKLACRDDVESRLVQHKRSGKWQLEHGPFTQETLDGLPAKNWGLLVSGINHFLPQGDALLNAFDFIPRARLDDLMVSYAPTGGGVGPHFDPYDVFLIQGLGQRRWEISDQDDRTLIEGAPLRILNSFTPTQTWELESGDMLYLPPQFAHNGVALGPCMTWSVGFRSPDAQEVLGQFLTYLQDQLCAEGLYCDPDLTRPRHPGEIPANLLAWAENTLNHIRWDSKIVTDFMGRYLSEPKAHVFFEPPKRALPLTTFAEKLQAQGIRLDPRSQLLFHGHRYFINGETFVPPTGTSKLFQKLADCRQLPPTEANEGTLALLYDWYTAGYVSP